MNKIMKKISILLCLTLMLALMACSSPQDPPEVEFTYIHGEDYYFSTVEDLVTRVDHVFVGTVTDMSFNVISTETGRAPTPECNPERLSLGRTYYVTVLTAYKGAERDVMRVTVDGGIKGYREEEQLALIQEAGAHYWDGVYRIPIEVGLYPLEMGETYLFAVLDLRIELDGYSDFVGIVNATQSLLELNDPFEIVHDNSGLSAEAIISEFGEEAFEEHWENWQHNTPDWEQRLEEGNVSSRVYNHQDYQGDDNEQ